MKKLATLVTLLPGAALAHGGHPPVAEAAHAGVHGMIISGLAVALVVLAAGWVRRDRT